LFIMSAKASSLPAMCSDRATAGVVAGLDDDAVQQVADGHLAADLDEHPRTAGTPGVFADGHRVVLADLATTDFQGGDVGGHQLGQAGWRQALVTVVLDQHVAAGRVHEYVGLGGQLRWRRHHLLGREGGRRDQQQYRQAKAFGKVVMFIRLSKSLMV
jgi:hypothetical protein